MGTTGNHLICGLDREKVADSLDELHAFELVSALWCHTVNNRLVGTAIYVLLDKLNRQVHTSLGYAKRLAARIAQLGGVITCGPTQLLVRSAQDRFVLPEDPSGPASLVRVGLSAPAARG